MVCVLLSRPSFLLGFMVVCVAYVASSSSLSLCCYLPRSFPLSLSCSLSILSYLLHILFLLIPYLSLLFLFSVSLYYSFLFISINLVRHYLSFYSNFTLFLYSFVFIYLLVKIVSFAFLCFSFFCERITFLSLSG